MLVLYTGLCHSDFQRMHVEVCTLWGSVSMEFCVVFAPKCNTSTDDCTHQSVLPTECCIDLSVEVVRM